jgi:RNA polymerase sigma-70 factor (ECF subfamily)
MEAALNWGEAMQPLEENAPGVLDSDAQLMLRFRNGETGAFDQLFSRHTRAIINFAYRFVRERQTAEELAQDIFLRVYESASRYRVEAKFTTWLYRIATNVCLNEIRKSHLRAGRLPLEAIARGPLPACALGCGSSPEKLLEREAISRAIREALNRIPEKQRIAFVLNKYQEFSYAEVAEIMGISEKAVKSLIHRAREALTERLKPILPDLLNL